MDDRANLRAMFSPGAQAQMLAREVFTDRTTERLAFRDSLASMASALDELDVQDLAAPRRNLLYFYGIGGIGKSRLLNELQRMSTMVSGLPGDPRIVTCATDMGSGGLDPERLLLQMRAKFGAAMRRAEAFDLVAASYWERAHSGETITQFLSRDSALKRHAETAGLSEHLRTAVEEVTAAAVGTSVVASIGSTGARLLRDRVRTSRQARRVSGEVPWFDHLLMADPTVETFSYLAALLSWDLAQEHRARPVLPVAFVDTFEAIAGPDRRQDEAVIQRICYLMPNVLWVIGGRDRIEWADRGHGTDMEYSGAACWPLLATKTTTDQEPRQHLLGYLSPEDCDAYLSEVLLGADGAPLIPIAVRRRITDGSDGLPLYLDLAVNQYLSATRGGTEIDLAEFGLPFASVVSRVLRDLAEAERQVLRAVCVFDRFDSLLASAAAGNPSDAVVRRVLARSYVDDDDVAPFARSLPDALRESIRTVDEDLDDGWSEREWAAAADRGLRHLEGRWRAFADASDRSGADAALGQGLAALRDATEVPRWLATAAADAVHGGRWNVLRTVRLPPDDAPAARAGVLFGFAGIAERRFGSLERSAELLDRALVDPSSLDPVVRDLFRLHRANAQRNHGAYRTIRTEYASLTSSPDPRVAWFARYQLADLDLLDGRFGAALAARDLATADPYLEVERFRLIGHVHRCNADFGAASEAYARALEEAGRSGGVGLEAKVRTNLIETWIWTDPERVRSEIDDVQITTEANGNVLDLCKIAAVRVLLLGAADGPATLPDLVARALERVRSSGYRAGEIFVRTAECAAATRQGDLQRSRTAAARVTALSEELGVYRYWASICDLWSSHREVDRSWDEFDWLDGAVQDRWRRAVVSGDPP